MSQFQQHFLNQRPNFVTKTLILFAENGRLGSCFCVGILLELNSFSLNDDMSTVIGLPKCLDPEAIKSILKYLHGFPFFKPPTEKLGDFYLVAIYLKVRSLAIQLRDIIERLEVSSIDLTKLDNKAASLAPPLQIPPSEQLHSISQLP